jgi:Domain of unknown function (DUF1983)
VSNTNLPWISSDIPLDLRQFLERVRETLGGNEYVRRMDYLSGTIPRHATDPLDPMPPPPRARSCGSPVIPTAPTGLTAAAGGSGFLLSWDMPGYCGHHHTEVYGLRRDGRSSELTVRNMLGESSGVMYSHVVDRPEDYWCFWIKHVNVDDVEGPFTGAGVCAKTAIDPKAIADALKGQITASHLFHTLGERIDLIDVSKPVSTLTRMAALSGRVIYATTPPTLNGVTPPLAAGDMWVETDAYYTDAPTIQKTYRWTGSAWVLLSRNQINQLSTAVINETLFRADADAIEASQREGLFAGAFAGIGNSYRYFVQATAPTNAEVTPDLVIGDIWAWRDPQTDSAAVFKRWCGSFWRVATVQTEPLANNNVDANRRPARFLGSSAARTVADAPVAPAAPEGGYVIGDQFLWTCQTLENGSSNPGFNHIYRYNDITAPGWTLLDDAAPEALAAALVYSERNVRAESDAALASQFDLVYARLASDSRPNLCPDASFEEFDAADYVGAGTFSAFDTNYGRTLRKLGSFTETNATLELPAFAVVAGRQYAATANLRVTGATSGSAQVGIRYYQNADGTGMPVSYFGTAVTAPVDYPDVFVVAGSGYEQRAKVLVVATAPAGYVAARLVFRWTAVGATQIGITRPQAVVITAREQAACPPGAVVDATLGRCPMPSFAFDSTLVRETSALVADINTARIGYCTTTTAPTYTTDHANRTSCEAAGHQWNVGLPWATAVKQVAVTTAGYCVVNGVVDGSITLSGACTAAGGVWMPPATAAVQQTFEAQQQLSGALAAQYSVKIDNAGYVTGFGLASQVNSEGIPFSEFMVRADRFAIAAPSNPTLQKTVTALTRSGTVGTCTFSGSLPGVAGDRVTISNATSGYWNRDFTLATVVGSTVTFAGVNVDAPTPAVAVAGKSLLIAKVAVPFIVNTTTTYKYAPAVVSLGASDIAVMTTSYGVRVSINGGASYLTCALPRNGSAGLTASEVVNAINATAASLVVATVGLGFAGLDVASKLATAEVALRVSWSATLFIAGTCPASATIPAGVYIDDLYALNATIKWAQIDTATIDWLNITRQLKANNILAGNVGVTTCIGSPDYAVGLTGWRICGAGNAEFNEVTIRGDLRGGAATAFNTGKGYFLGAAGDAHLGDPAANSVYWQQSTGALTIKGDLLGGAATTLTSGIGYYLGATGTARIGNPATNNIQWNGSGLVLTGTACSATWNGHLTAAGVIDSPGSAGWVIDAAGNAEFGTLALRANAVSQGAFTPGEGASLPAQVLTFPPTWVNGTPYAIGALVYYTPTGLIYICKIATSSVLPTNTTYWGVSSNYVNLASITVPASEVAAGQGGGVVFFGQAQAYSTSATAPTSRNIGVDGDIQVRLVQDVGGTLTVIGDRGLVLSYGGLLAGNHYYSVPISVFDYAGTRTGLFKLQAKSNVSGVTINVNSISLGYLAMKR